MTAGGTRADCFTILHLIPTLEVGGSQRQLRLLALEQARQGHEVHVGLLRGGPHQDAMAGSSVRFHGLSHRGHHDPRLVAEVLGLIRRSRPDVVQTWLTQMDVLGGWAARASFVPWILSERSSADFYSPTVKNWARVHAARGASASVANSAGGRDYWAAMHRVRAPIAVVPNAVPLDEIDRAIPVSPTSDVPTVLFVGRFTEEKNIPSPIDAFRIVLEEVDAELVLCGDGEERPRVENHMRAQGLEGRVRLLGMRDDVIGRMKTASAFVSLSRHEGCPNSVLEAMATGCPLVLSNIQAHRDIVDPRAGLLVDAADAGAVAAALVSTLRGTADAAARTRNARRAVEGLSPSAAAEGFGRIYRQVAAASSGRRRRTVG